MEATVYHGQLAACKQHFATPPYFAQGSLGTLSSSEITVRVATLAEQVGHSAGVTINSINVDLAPTTLQPHMYFTEKSNGNGFVETTNNTTTAPGRSP